MKRHFVCHSSNAYSEWLPFEDGANTGRRQASIALHRRSGHRRDGGHQGATTSWPCDWRKFTRPAWTEDRSIAGVTESLRRRHTFQRLRRLGTRLPRRRACEIREFSQTKEGECLKISHPREAYQALVADLKKPEHAAWLE